MFFDYTDSLGDPSTIYVLTVQCVDVPGVHYSIHYDNKTWKTKKLVYLHIIEIKYKFRKT